MARLNQENIDLDNPEFQHVWNLIRHTHRSVFLTGKAGTGKSTFLRYICAHTKKRYVVLAPTGVAAVNVGGQTLHSFFKIPFKPLLPDDPDFSERRIKKTLRYSSDKVKLIRNLDLIIIDEISMVRADVIDFVDRVLRFYCGNRREPFGGKQLLFVGDIFQLEPVVTRDMKQILSRYYQQFFFFNARVFNDLGLIPIELQKIYRQNDKEFVALLDRVRVNRATAADLQMLNAHVNENADNPHSDKFVMTLATRRDTVNAINQEHIDALQSPEFHYKGEITDSFPENDLPTLLELVLKEGAQVIFVRNDKDGRWVNGTIAKVASLSEKQIIVELEDEEYVEVLPEVWENIQYTFNEQENKIEEKLLGTFTQYPLKLAWALTVHKSQGMTFNHVVLDFVGGAFTGGQTYVALSRCTSIDGISLLKPITQRDIFVNSDVVNFSRTFNDEAVIGEAMHEAKARRLYLQANSAFEKGEMRQCVSSMAEAILLKNELENPVIQRLIAIKLSRQKLLTQHISELQEIIDTQQQLLKDLAREYAQMGRIAMDSDQPSGAGEPTVAYGRKSLPVSDIAAKSALANFDKALRIDPQCVEAMVGKAMLLINAGNYVEAEARLVDACKLERKNWQAWMQLGRLQRLQQNFDDAEDCFVQAAKADGKRPEPHDALAELYDTLDMDEAADAERARAAELRGKRGRGRRRR